MADFDEQLSGLFLTETDEALGQRLADSALARIEQEDGRRRTILAAGGAAGIGATLFIVDLSGGLGVLRGIGEEALRLAPTGYVWTAAAAALAVYAAAVSLRRLRTA